MLLVKFLFFDINRTLWNTLFFHRSLSPKHKSNYLIIRITLEETVSFIFYDAMKKVPEYMQFLDIFYIC